MGISPSEGCEGPPVAGIDTFVSRRECANEDLNGLLAFIISEDTITYQCGAPFTDYATLAFSTAELAYG